MSDAGEQQTQTQTEARQPDPWEAEDKRLRAIRDKRREAGVCIMCGKPFGFFDRLAKREQHKGCEQFKE